MIELRWATSSKAPKLQYRVAVAVDASGAFCPGLPGEWVDVPSDILQPGKPLTADDAIRLWHESTDAHKRESAFEWFAAGILAAEKAHGIASTASAGGKSANSPAGGAPSAGGGE